MAKNAASLTKNEAKNCGANLKYLIVLNSSLGNRFWKLSGSINRSYSVIFPTDPPIW